MASDDWPRLPIGLIAKPRLGGNYANSSSVTARPLIKMGNIARINMDVSKLDYIVDGEKVSDEHRLHFGDVLLNTRNTLDLVGKVSVWRDELPVGYFNSNILRLEFDSRFCGASEYFGYALNTKESIDAIRSLATGTTSVAAIYTRDLLKLTLPVPDAVEQRAIAQALRDVDRSLDSFDQLLRKKRAIQQGMMQELLTGRTRLSGFAGEWKRVSAGDIGVFKGGSGFPIRHQGHNTGKYPYFKVSDMNRPGNETFMAVANNYISEAVRATLGATVFPAGAIVLAKVGAAVFLERKRQLIEPSCIDNNMAAFVLDASLVDARFIHYALLNFPISSLVAVGALPSLNGTQLRSIPLEFPVDLAEQQAIAGILGDAEDEIATIGRRVEATRAIKEGMMQELMTGRTRLVSAAASL